MGAPPPTTAPAPSPAPGHPGHHLHHPGHHSHHPSRHLHHPGPQEGGGGQVDPGQIPGLQVSQDSIFHPPFAPLSNPPPPSPRPPSRNLDTQDTLNLTGATPPLLDAPRLPPHFLLADIPADQGPADQGQPRGLPAQGPRGRHKVAHPPHLLLPSSSPPPPPPLLQVHRLVSTKDRLQGFLLKALEEVSRWPSLLTFSSSSSSPPPPPPPPPLPSTHPPRPLINCFPPDRSLLVLASREGEEVVIPALAALARTRCGIISLFSKCDL